MKSILTILPSARSSHDSSTPKVRKRKVITRISGLAMCNCGPKFLMKKRFVAPLYVEYGALLT
jgi:hypothetical protein